MCHARCEGTQTHYRKTTDANLNFVVIKKPHFFAVSFIQKSQNYRIYQLARPDPHQQQANHQALRRGGAHILAGQGLIHSQPPRHMMSQTPTQLPKKTVRTFLCGSVWRYARLGSGVIPLRLRHWVTSSDPGPVGQWGIPKLERRVRNLPKCQKRSSR